MELIQSLHRIKGIHAQTPILTLYLGCADRRVPHNSYYISQLHSIISTSMTAEEKTKWRRDIARIELFLKESTNRNVRSYVFVVGDGIWEVFSCPFFLSPLCIVLHNPYTKPIDDALATYQRYVIVLADRDHATVFAVGLGQVEKQYSVPFAPVPQNVKHGENMWDAQDKIFRHAEDCLHKNLQMLSKSLVTFIGENQTHNIILAGHKSLFSKIKTYLPHEMKSFVLGEIACEFSISPHELVEKSVCVLEKNEEETERSRLEVSLQ